MNRTRNLLLSLSATVMGLILGALPTAAVAQVIDARMSGKAGDEGKCTFEVVVQGTADVQIRGSQGRIVTDAGNPAQWRRLDCNEPLPYNPGNFKFKGIDGHGQQSLAAVPNSNNGIAVIHIMNNSSRNEGYTGEIEWRGTSATAWNGPPPNATSSGYWGAQGNAVTHWNNGWNDADDASWNSGSYSNWNSAGSGAAAAAQACQDYIARRVSREHGEVVNVQILPDTVTIHQGDGGLVRVKGQGQYQSNGGASGGFEFRCEYDTQSGQIANAGYHR